VPVATRGLTHVALHVEDPERSATFYGAMFGARVTYRDSDHVEVQTPGAFDAIAFLRSRGARTRGDGVEHFGFRLRKESDMATAVRAAREAGAKKIRTGTFGPNEPYLFFHDPDGCEVEVWYEPPATRPRIPKR